MLQIIQAIFLGIVEGLTEFLPISSTGHLYLSERMIGYKDTAEIFTVVIQLGAILAVIWYYRRDLIVKTTGLFKGNTKQRKFWANWIVATIPAGIAGYLLVDYMDKFSTNVFIAVALIIGGLLILLIENYHDTKQPSARPQLDKLTIKQSLAIGCHQVLAIIPGVSRSGATIMGGLLSGLDRVTATAFSFYMSIPIIVIASGYKLMSGRDQLSSVSGGGTALLLGTVAAFFTALLAIGWLLRYVSKNDFKPFAYYRIILGGVILVSLLLG